MIKISTLVYEKIQGDDIAFEALQSGILNLRAYARSIKPIIEKELYKPVQLGSIVTALSRMNCNSKSISPLKPNVNINDISIKSPLAELVFEKSKNIIQKISKLYLSRNIIPSSFLTITHGVDEINIIASANLKQDIILTLRHKPHIVYDSLSAVTVRFPETYLEIPNVIYALIGSVALKRINLIEVISTLSELTFIVRDKDLERTIDALKLHTHN